MCALTNPYVKNDDYVSDSISVCQYETIRQNSGLVVLRRNTYYYTSHHRTSFSQFMSPTIPFTVNQVHTDDLAFVLTIDTIYYSNIFSYITE